MDGFGGLPMGGMNLMQPGESRMPMNGGGSNLMQAVGQTWPSACAFGGPAGPGMPGMPSGPGMGHFNMPPGPGRPMPHPAGQLPPSLSPTMCKSPPERPGSCRPDFMGAMRPGMGHPEAAFRPRAPRPHSHPYRPQRPPQVRPRPATVPPRVVPTRPDLGKTSESLETSKDAPDAGSKWPAEEAAPEVIPAVEEATPMEERQWFYKDASGMVQGPFSSSVMSSWPWSHWMLL